MSTTNGTTNGHTGASAYNADRPGRRHADLSPAWRPDAQQAGQGLVLSTPARRWFLVPAQRPLMADRRRSGHCGTAERMCMDHAKIDALHVALSAHLLTASTQDEMTPAEVLCTVTRVFAWLAAARASMVGGSLEAQQSNLEAYLFDAKTIAEARLSTHHHPAPASGPEA